MSGTKTPACPDFASEQITCTRCGETYAFVADNFPNTSRTGLESLFRLNSKHSSYLQLPVDEAHPTLPLRHPHGPFYESTVKVEEKAWKTQRRSALLKLSFSLNQSVTQSSAPFEPQDSRTRPPTSQALVTNISHKTNTTSWLKRNSIGQHKATKTSDVSQIEVPRSRSRQIVRPASKLGSYR